MQGVKNLAKKKLKSLVKEYKSIHEGELPQKSLFDRDLTEDKVKMASPEKRQQRFADPGFKPFLDKSSSSDDNYSDSVIGSYSARSEDASPHRKRMLRSPTKKAMRKKIKEKAMESMLEESQHIDD